MARRVRVGTVRLNNVVGSVVDKKKYCSSLVELAAKHQPDIICLPENFHTFRTDRSIEELAESVPGPTTDDFSKKAKKYNTYIICPLLTIQNDKYFNSAVIIDRTGNIQGIHNKNHLVTTNSEYTLLERGLSLGTENELFTLDFGIIGLQICFDIEFPEGWMQLSRKGAEIVFWPSAYDGGFPLQSYAYFNSYYIVSAVRSSYSRIINPLGKVVAGTNEKLPIVVQELNLDYIVCHTDFHRDIWSSIIAEYGSRVNVFLLEEESRFMVECNDRSITIKDIASEFGLASVRDYINWHYDVYFTIQNKKKLKPIRTPFFSRAKS